MTEKVKDRKARSITPFGREVVPAEAECQRRPRGRARKGQAGAPVVSRQGGALLSTCDAAVPPLRGARVGQLTNPPL